MHSAYVLHEQLVQPQSDMLISRAASSFLLCSSKPIVCHPLTPSTFTISDIVHSLVDSCCTETFGGLVLSTQYWDTYTGLEDQGQLLPPKTWTLHGLWPDFCNGSYTQYYDLSRQYDPKWVNPSCVIGDNGANLDSGKVPRQTRQMASRMGLSFLHTMGLTSELSSKLSGSTIYSHI